MIQSLLPKKKDPVADSISGSWSFMSNKPITQKEIIQDNQSSFDDKMEIDVHGLINTAIEKDISVEVLEKLLDMAMRVKRERAERAFYRALALFEQKCPSIERTKWIPKKGDSGYFYAPLDSIVSQVKKLLTKCGFSFFIEAEQKEGSVTAICYANHVYGYTKATKFTVPIDPDAYMNNQQQFGSALTYAKRYAFCNAFGIMTADIDDDASEAGEIKDQSKNNKNQDQSDQRRQNQPAGNNSRKKRGSHPKKEKISQSRMIWEYMKDALAKKKLTKIEFERYTERFGNLQSDPKEQMAEFRRLKNLIEPADMRKDITKNPGKEDPIEKKSVEEAEDEGKEDQLDIF